MAVTVFDATGNPTTISKILKENYEEPFLKALDQDTFAFQLFKRKATEDAYIRWRVKYSGNTGVEWYDEDDAYGTAGKQSFETASVNVKQVRINVEFSGLAEAATRSKGSYVNVKADELESAMGDLRDAINDKIIGAALPTAKEIDNLFKIVADDNTYAGIDRTLAANDWFRAFDLDNAAVNRALSVGLMQKMTNELDKPRRKARPNYILTSQTHADQYGDLADARRRWEGNRPAVDLAVGKLTYKDIPVVPVHGLADGRMYFIDTRSWNTYMLVPFETDEVSVNRDSSVYAIKSYLQLVCRAPFQQGVIRDLAA